MIGELKLIMLVVRDMGRSVRFYRDVIGLKLMFETPGWAQLDAGNIQLGLHPESEHLKARPNESCSFGFYVQDIEHAVADLRARGATILMEPKKEEFGMLALAADPDGYTVQLYQENAKADSWK
jgi:lactoylglutathione lyase